MSKTMSDDRVLELIEAYGADPDLWPEDERAAARARLDASPDLFADALASAREIDAMICEADMALPSDALMERLLADIPQAVPAGANWLERVRGLIAPPGQIWPIGAALASLVLGAMIGLNVSAPVTATLDEDEAIVYAALGLADYDMVYEEYK